MILHMVEACHYAFVQTDRIHYNHSEPQWKLRTLDDYDVSGSSAVTKVPLWWGMLIMGKAVHMWRYRAYGNSVYLPLNFAGNFILLQKTKSWQSAFS